MKNKLSALWAGVKVNPLFVPVVICLFCIQVFRIRRSLELFAINPAFVLLLILSVTAALAVVATTASALRDHALYAKDKNRCAASDTSIRLMVFFLYCNCFCMMTESALCLICGVTCETAADKGAIVFSLFTGIGLIIFSHWLGQRELFLNRKTRAWNRILKLVPKAGEGEVNAAWVAYVTCYDLSEAELKEQGTELAEAWLKSRNIIHASYVAEYDGGKLFFAHCLVNMETKEVSDIDLSDYATLDNPLDIDLLEDEYVFIKRHRYPLATKADKEAVPDMSEDFFWHDEIPYYANFTKLD